MPQAISKTMRGKEDKFVKITLYISICMLHLETNDTTFENYLQAYAHALEI